LPSLFLVCHPSFSSVIPPFLFVIPEGNLRFLLRLFVLHTNCKSTLAVMSLKFVAIAKNLSKNYGSKECFEGAGL
jgi:hypothetical protein